MVQFKISVALLLQVAVMAIALAPRLIVALPMTDQQGKEVMPVGSPPAPTRLTIKLPA